MMNIGFTGTQRGMNSIQLEVLRKWLLSMSWEGDYPHRAHHGDCIGADSQFHDLIRELFPRTAIWGHPGFKSYKRAFKQCDILLPVKPPLERNKDIVRVADYLFATPRQPREVIRSGTWATIRYARQTATIIKVIYPDGSSK